MDFQDTLEVLDSAEFLNSLEFLDRVWYGLVCYGMNNGKERHECTIRVG